jgi:hypothetical protein
VTHGSNTPTQNAWKWEYSNSERITRPNRDYGSIDCAKTNERGGTLGSSAEVALWQSLAVIGPSRESMPMAGGCTICWHPCLNPLRIPAGLGTNHRA